ncbi:hypothetical protein Rsub_13116 [Raphidocelis subcapitata]|uniref:Uncharacterized protein n=1 Tax=Raphidocelis subcapitata TaxID=307507 RepID=A0A2V0PJK7_9CHLO|nr:hypothetical protein Rsub_13116 [Raphidocelis subcapitata]|eukprot:GBF99984.1 hypothetical protein Rsub_13116 [Raphidocelis subcapitata]
MPGLSSTSGRRPARATSPPPPPPPDPPAPLPRERPPGARGGGGPGGARAERRPFADVGGLGLIWPAASPLSPRAAGAGKAGAFLPPPPPQGRAGRRAREAGAAAAVAAAAALILILLSNPAVQDALEGVSDAAIDAGENLGLIYVPPPPPPPRLVLRYLAYGG